MFLRRLAARHEGCPLHTRFHQDKGQETANQLQQLREFCGAQGWAIIGEYEDHESAGKAERAQFKAMMLHAALRKFDVVLFWALDRFSREGSTKRIPT